MYLCINVLYASGFSLEDCDVGPGRAALAAVASEPTAVDAVFSTPARSRSVCDFLISRDFAQPHAVHT